VKIVGADRATWTVKRRILPRPRRLLVGGRWGISQSRYDAT
jgi:hypothetical protein